MTMGNCSSMRCLVTVLCLCAAAPLSAQQRADVPPSAAVEAAELYVIGPEDVIEITVWNNADLSRTVPVRPDGKISLPLLHDVQAAGLAPMQLRAALTKAMEKYVADPVVSVIVREVHSFKVTVIGEVKTPGRYELRSRATVLDVLAMAGGLTQYAARGRITILRHDIEGVHQLPFDFEKVIGKGVSTGTAQQNLCIQAGDIIIVP
jgi:polysaccharide export outer membrane protein